MAWRRKRELIVEPSGASSADATGRPRLARVPGDPAGSDGAAPAARPARGLSFRTNLVLGVCGVVLLTGLAVLLVLGASYRQTTSTMAGDLFGGAGDHAVTQARAFVLRAAPLAETVGGLADGAMALDDSNRLARQLTDVLRANPGLTWVSYGDERGSFTGAYRPADTSGVRVNQSRIEDGKTRLVEHDVLDDDKWRLHRREADTGYDPRQRPFYVRAREAGRLVWLPPYAFYDRGGAGVTCARPVYARDGSLRGVLTVDFDLGTLCRFVDGLSVSANSRFFLFTPDGSVLAYPGMAGAATRPNAATGELLRLADVNDPVVRTFRQQLRPVDLLPNEAPPEPGSAAMFAAPAPRGAGASRHFTFRHGGETYIGSVRAFWVGPDLPWVVGGIAPADDFLGPLRQARLVAVTIALGAVTVALGLAAGLARRVSGPVESLIRLMRRVGGGDLEARAALGGTREFRELSSALNQMIGDLRDRLRLRYSLAVATDVQQRLLPASPPKVPGLEIAGHCTYCDETGGDYYDFLVVDRTAPHTLLVCMGDVMGHGVAAALVMAGARAVLRDRATPDGGLAHLLGRINALLVSDVGTARFMTMHLSLINTRDGTFRWAAAGHDPAIIYDPQRDAFIEIDEGDLPLGVDEAGTYGEHTYGPLTPGAVILIGTDGVWETANAGGELFGKDRLRDVIRTCAAEPARDITNAIASNLKTFRGDAERTDDVTFVVLKYTGVVPQFVPDSTLAIDRPIGERG